MSVTEAETSLARRLRALRDRFDEAFAEPRASMTGGERVRVLRVAAGTARYAVTLGACAALLPSPAVHPMPGGHPAFVGLAMVQGAMVPVYRLAALVETAPGERTPAWLLVTRGTDPIGLLVEAVEGPEAVEPPQNAETGISQATVRFRGAATRLLPLDTLVDDLRRELDRQRPD
jgi:chemotaxis signal transduction protein